MKISETFGSLPVADMARATAFYTGTFGATIGFATPGWSSLFVAGVRIGLYPVADHPGSRGGLHFVVDDLAAACAEIEAAGGRVVTPASEVAPGVIIAEVADTEGNVLTLRAV